MFFLALLVLSTVVAAPTVLSSIQREREKEMIWRGKQYTRGIRMYYLKMHRFPTSLDDLTKPKTGIRFMRQAYKDPMNRVDGSWRLIYVGPNGQLIGSLSDRSLGMNGQMGSQGAMGTQAGGSSIFSSGSGFGNSGSNLMNTSASFGSNQSAGSTQTGAVGTALQPGTSTTDPNAPNSDSSNNMGQPHSLAGPMDASNTIGGNIIGVGSKINKKSFMVYEKAKNYRQFEFIWDPSKDITGQASVGVGTPVQNMNGTNPAGTATTGSPFSTGTNPVQNPNPAANPNPGSTLSPNENPPLQAPPPNQ
jgi:hypothetical protein